MSEVVKKWYVIRAVSGQEKKVKQHLEAEIGHLGLNDFVSQVLIPTEKVFQVRNGKKVGTERSLFPGYIYIEANLVGEMTHIIENINGVIGFLGPKGEQPVPLRPSEVNRILGAVDAMADADEIISSPFFIGDNVRVIEGAFNNFSGVVEEVNEERKKLKLMVKIFGRKQPLEVNFSQVEKE